MASKQTGIAVCFGFPGAVAIAGIADFLGFKDSGEFGADHSVDEVVDEDGDAQTLLHHGEKIEGTLNFTPRAKVGTNTNAQAKESLGKPEKGSTVTLSSFAAPATTGDWINGTWVYVGGFKAAFSKAGVATYTMKIRRGPDGINLTTAVT